MSALLVSLLPSLFPAVADGVRGLFNKMTGFAGAKPANVAEVVQLMQADTARLQSLAALDQPSGNVSQWVANIRALQRPLAVVLIIVGYLYGLYAADHLPPATLEGLSQYAQMVTFYLFGDRSYMYLKGASK